MQPHGQQRNSDVLEHFTQLDGSNNVVCKHCLTFFTLSDFTFLTLSSLCSATLSLAYRGSLDPDHILYELLAGPPDAHRERLKSRRPFVSAAQRLLHDLSELDIHAAQWTDYKWSHGVLDEHIWSPCLHSQDYHQVDGNGPTQTIVGKAQPLEDWCWAFSVVHAQMGARFYIELWVRRNRTNCRPSWHTPHIGHPEEFMVWQFWKATHDAG